jgi:hypothetical protein
MGEPIRKQSALSTSSGQREVKGNVSRTAQEEVKMSPIKGISEKVLLPRLGKIRLGTKEQRNDGSSCPMPTDHFVCPDEVKKVFGEKPRELRIMFPTEEKEQWASQYLRRYSDSLQLICRGDGEKAVTYYGMRVAKVDTASSASHLKEIACDPLTCGYYRSGDCRRVMNLQVLLPDCPGFGVYQLDTGSFYSICNVNSALTFIQSVSPRVSMIPFSLQLVEKEVQPEGWPKTVYVLRLTWTESLFELQKFAQTPPGRALLIPPPDGEAPGDLAFPSPIGEESKAAPVAQEESLMELWAKAKSKIWRFDIQDYQITKWFDGKYGVKVGLEDFDLPIPPSKLSSAMLSFFCQYVDLACSRE